MSPNNSIDPRWFRQVLGQYPTGVCIITARQEDDSRVGFVVGSFTSVSLDPPLVAFFPDKGSTTWPKIRGAGKFCVNILSADQEDVCRIFAGRTQDKFAGIHNRQAASGSPIIDGVVAWIDCDLESVQEAGDHYMVLGRVRELNVEESTLPLLFFEGGYGRFAPLSLAAPDIRGALTAQLRDVDLIRKEMEQLARDLSAWTIATAAVGGELVVVASARSVGNDAAATIVGQRLPDAPPHGAVFAAWRDETGIEEWLKPLKTAEECDAQRERLAAVRRRGYSVLLSSEAQRIFASTLDRAASEPGTVEPEDLSGLARVLTYDPVDLSPDLKRAIRSIAVPVFNQRGDVALALSIYGFPKPDASGGIDRYIERACLAGRQATDLLGGHTRASA
jgi:flavin reductase (DIM6/NTAB) family NADH-FMN oxidoreductase RutF/DNA-binding IclR family transcriptional regulator